MKNIAVLVSGGGSNLQSLIDNMKNINGKIVLVVSSSEDAYALQRAKNHNIESIVLQNNDVNHDDNLISELQRREVDLVVLAGYMRILSKKIISRFKNRIINIHPSLIPSFCGKGYYGIKVAKAMLEYGVKIAGATVHFVDEGADTGAIILQKCIDIFDSDTASSLQKRVLESIEHKILPEAVRLYCDDKLEVLGRIVKIKE